MYRSLLRLAWLFALTACSTTSGPQDAGKPDSGPGDAGDGGPANVSPGDQGQPQVSRTLALSADGTSIWVVNTESDSLSQIDVQSLALTQEIPLATQAPAVDDGGRYEPLVRPRAVALVDSLGKAYVAGQAANSIFVVNTGTGVVASEIPVPAEPVSVVASPDGSAVYAVCHESNVALKIDTQSDRVVATAPLNPHPWGASLRADGSLLYVTYLLLGPGVTTIDTQSFQVTGFTALPDQPQLADLDPLLPQGMVRGEYAVVPRPNDGTLWIPHMLLATLTAQTSEDPTTSDLRFDTTAFPTVTRLAPGGDAVQDRLLFRPPGVDAGQISDSVCGPHDVAFTPDGKLALVTMAQSEDVMVFDASSGYELPLSLVRPTLGSLLEGIVVDAAGTHAYVHGRSSNSLTVLDIDEGNSDVPVQLDGRNGDGGISTVESDPMPPELRDGFQMFYSANIVKRPITTNYWMACATCHLEGGTDAVTWRFLQGPRDTPSNAGGKLHTGFLMRNAVRNAVIQYDDIIRLEQGGDYSRSDGGEEQLEQLEHLADFVNDAIPFPQNPNRVDGGLTPLQSLGKSLFSEYCMNCHQGAYLTNSGVGNKTLDLTGDAGPVTLESIGTCVVDGGFDDQPTVDIYGDARPACSFNVPSLLGVFATAPWFHDGSAATLEDAASRIPAVKGMDAGVYAALAAYISTL